MNQLMMHRMMSSQIQKSMQKMRPKEADGDELEWPKDYHEDDNDDHDYVV